MLKAQKGGLWLELLKSPAAERPIGEMKAPSKVYLPLRQFKGNLPKLSVVEGNRVLMGQPITESAEGDSCVLHTPVSGVVDSIVDYDHPVGGKSRMIVIVNDGQDTPYKKSSVQPNPNTLKSADIIDAVKKAGAVVSESLGVPLWVKLSELARNRVKTVVINAVETEPFLCTSQKVMDENPEGVIDGLGLVMRCCGATRAILAVSDDIPHDVIHGMTESARLAGVALKVAHIPQKYPLGNERYLLRELFFRELNAAAQKGDAADSVKVQTGFVFAQDCVNIRRAVLEDEPQITKVITVAGDAIENPQNLEVRIGTTVRDVLEYCGLSFDPDRVVLGSAMRGVAVTNLSTPITKSVGAVLALKAVRGGFGKSICINCGKCAGVCPQRLMPNYIAMRAVKADFDALRELHISDCIECGSCAYICPGHMPIVELIKNIKKAAL